MVFWHISNIPTRTTLKIIYGTNAVLWHTNDRTEVIIACVISIHITMVIELAETVMTNASAIIIVEQVWLTSCFHYLSALLKRKNIAVMSQGTLVVITQLLRNKFIYIHKYLKAFGNLKWRHHQQTAEWNQLVIDTHIDNNKSTYHLKIGHIGFLSWSGKFWQGLIGQVPLQFLHY